MKQMFEQIVKNQGVNPQPNQDTPTQAEPQQNSAIKNSASGFASALMSLVKQSQGGLVNSQVSSANAPQPSNPFARLFKTMMDRQKEQSASTAFDSAMIFNRQKTEPVSLAMQEGQRDGLVRKYMPDTSTKVQR